MANRVKQLFQAGARSHIVTSAYMDFGDAAMMIEAAQEISERFKTSKAQATAADYMGWVIRMGFFDFMNAYILSSDTKARSLSHVYGQNVREPNKPRDWFDFSRPLYKLANEGIKSGRRGQMVAYLVKDPAPYRYWKVWLSSGDGEYYARSGGSRPYMAQWVEYDEPFEQRAIFQETVAGTLIKVRDDSNAQIMTVPLHGGLIMTRSDAEGSDWAWREDHYRSNAQTVGNFAKIVQMWAQGVAGGKINARRGRRVIGTKEASKAIGVHLSRTYFRTMRGKLDNAMSRAAVAKMERDAAENAGAFSPAALLSAGAGSHFNKFIKESEWFDLDRWEDIRLIDTSKADRMASKLLREMGDSKINDILDGRVNQFKAEVSQMGEQERLKFIREELFNPKNMRLMPSSDPAKYAELYIKVGKRFVAAGSFNRSIERRGRFTTAEGMRGRKMAGAIAREFSKEWDSELRAIRNIERTGRGHVGDVAQESLPTGRRLSLPEREALINATIESITGKALRK